MIRNILEFILKYGFGFAAIGFSIAALIAGISGSASTAGLFVVIAMMFVAISSP